LSGSVKFKRKKRDISTNTRTKRILSAAGSGGGGQRRFRRDCREDTVPIAKPYQWIQISRSAVIIHISTIIKSGQFPDETVWPSNEDCFHQIRITHPQTRIPFLASLTRIKIIFVSLKRAVSMINTATKILGIDGVSIVIQVVFLGGGGGG
jgi:hypothetical protein